MAIVHKEGNDDAWLVLWRITEDVSELARLATSAEIVQAKRIRNDARRREWLAWRAALREMIPEAQPVYRKNGAPALAAETRDGAGYIGVSHTGDLAAVIYSRHTPCAVDVELLNRDFRRAEPRYLSDDERRLTGYGATWFPALLWCAKETLYKHAGLSGVDFRDEIRIVSIDPEPGKTAGRLTGRIRGGSAVPMAYFTFGDHLVVHTDI